MSGFLPNEPNTFINIKLTDAGRRLLSLGQLTFANYALSDREINYGIDPTGFYSISNNRVLAPKDVEPIFSNFDGRQLLPLNASNISSVKQSVTAMTDSVGFFTGTTNSFAIDSTAYITKLTISYSGSGLPQGSSSVVYDSGSATPSNPQSGQLIYIPWEPIQNSGKTYDSSTLLASGNPTVDLWYRIMTADTGTNTLYLDRPVPNFGSLNTSQKINAYVYPFNGIDTYYSTAYTTPISVWNLNIVRTSSDLGTNSSISGYTTYGSIEYNGTKTYLGFSSETRNIGIIHFTNIFTGNTYAEQLIEKTVQIDLPNVMWHRTTADVGKALTYGLTLTDVAGDTIYDMSANTSYRYLRDGSSTSNQILGRVYHKLKIAVITDQELLTALTYRSNRNYTLPAVNLGLTTVPKYPLTTTQATGLCQTGKTYYVTYLTESTSAYTSGSTFGYPKTLPCGYINRVKGEHDSNNNPTFLSIAFQANSFPYLRSSEDMNPSSALSGTGWNANKVQILINEVDNVSSNFDYDTIPSDGWKLISNGIGNGIYTGDTTDLTINPLKLQGNQFVISREDFTSGTSYVLDSIFTSNMDTKNVSGLTFGSESFLFGNLKSGIMATSFKTSIVVLADSSSFNSSINPTFSANTRQTYVTEIGIFSTAGELVATGKPTYPINKSTGRFLAFKLEYDF